jgi:hypothetical protein
MSAKQQDYKTHRRLVPGYHYLNYFLFLVIIVGGIVYACCDCPANVFPGVLISVTGLTLAITGFYARYFAVRAQDRAIRAEENFRHYLLTGKPLDSRLRTYQIVALRFAPDDEFVALAVKAAEEGLKNDAIKRLIKNWKGDFHRV